MLSIFARRVNYEPIICSVNSGRYRSLRQSAIIVYELIVAGIAHLDKAQL